ncbi:hypothetical protein H0W91_04340 [Patescibacteria group bacterium]|nr:hypothetical protein [Patescibacteria group bacterium]
MRNYHENSSLITATEIAKLDAAFQRSWSRDTAFPPSQHKWTEENKALGQCVPTALVIVDFYGGGLAYDEEVNHCWNIFPDGSEHDFSRIQFAGDTNIRISRINAPTDLLESEKGKSVNNHQRYALLKQRVNQSLRRE